MVGAGDGDFCEDVRCLRHARDAVAEGEARADPCVMEADGVDGEG